MITITQYILTPVVTYSCSFLKQNLFYGNLVRRTMSLEDILPMLPFLVYALILAAHAMTIYLIPQIKPKRYIKRRQKGYWTKSGPKWRARPPRHRIYQLQRRVLETYLSLRQQLNDEDHSSDKSTAATTKTSRHQALTATNKGYKTKRITFDSDSFNVAVDSGASYCILNSTRDFEGAITLTLNSVVDGIAAGLKVVGKGTIK